MAEILAETTRGGVVESVHHGVIAVADGDGRLVAGVGEVERRVFFRSSAKPFQAIPLIESGAADAFGLTAAELALCCASHHGEPHHQAEVAAMLAKIGLDETALRCGSPLPLNEAEAARVSAGLVAPSPLHCDCSGKHAGMLATCRHLGYPLASYLDPEHPLQQTLLAIMTGVLGVAGGEIDRGIDGCSLPTFGAPLATFARAYAALAAPARSAGGRGHAAALDRLRTAMAAHPQNVSGEGALVADLMALSSGQVVAKSGAEGLICLAIPATGYGIAIRVLDGSFRAHPAIVSAVLEQLDLVEPAVIAALRARHPTTLTNHNGIAVGEIRAAFDLSPHQRR